MIELESVAGLPKHWQGRVTAMHWRMGLRVGSLAKVFVLVNGAFHEYPWITVARVIAPGQYIGRSHAAWAHLLPLGVDIPFDFDNILAVVVEP